MSILLNTIAIDQQINELMVRWHSSNLPKPDSLLMHQSSFHLLLAHLSNISSSHLLSDSNGDIKYKGLFVMITNCHMEKFEIRLAKTIE